jgi:hypothetical protein
MGKYVLNGISSPGRVDIFGMGVVELEKLPESVQEKLYKSGCRYLAPVPEEMLKQNPGMKKIDVKASPFKK